jgi:hypothetical protein
LLLVLVVLVLVLSPMVVDVEERQTTALFFPTVERTAP